MFEKLPKIYDDAINNNIPLSEISEKYPFSPEEEKVILRIYSKNTPEDIITYVSSLDFINSFEDAEQLLVYVLAYSNMRFTAIAADPKNERPFEFEMLHFSTPKIDSAIKSILLFKVAEKAGMMLNGDK